MTKEQIIVYFNTQSIVIDEYSSDHIFNVLSLLRKIVPYNVCENIIKGAYTNILLLCDINDVVGRITEDDIKFLISHKVFINNHFDCFSISV